MALKELVINSTRTTRGYLLILTLAEESVDIVANTSKISYKLELTSDNYSYSQYGTGWEVIINGTRVNYHAREQTSTNPRIDTAVTKGNKTLICNGEINVAHNDDGTKTITAANISASIDIALSAAGPGPMSLTASSNWTLTTIARKSTLSNFGNGTLGSDRTMTVNTASNSFTHTLTYTCGTASGTMFTKQAASSITKYNFPITLASQNTKGTTVSVTVNLETFSGNTSLGSNSYTVTMTIPNNNTTKPSMGNITTGEPSGQNHLSVYGGYIQNISRMSVSFSPTGYAGASITSSSIKIGNMFTYSTNSKSSTDILTTYGTITITATATDSRGFSNTKTTTITVLQYEPPIFSRVSLTRCDTSGNPLENGTKGYLRFILKWYGNLKIPTNTVTLRSYYRKSTASSWTAGSTHTPENIDANQFGTEENLANYNFTADTNYSWYAYLTATDNFTTVTTPIVNMPSAAAYLKMDPVNNALSIGTAESSSNTFRVGWNSKFNNSINVTGKKSTFEYMPFTWVTAGTAGSAGYARIASVTAINTWTYGIITFTVARAVQDSRPVKLYLRILTDSGYSAAHWSLYYDSIARTGGTAFSAFAYQSSSDTVDVYVQKSHQNDWITVTCQPDSYAQDRFNITFGDHLRTSIPSGALSAVAM